MEKILLGYAVLVLVVALCCVAIALIGYVESRQPFALKAVCAFILCLPLSYCVGGLTLQTYHLAQKSQPHGEQNHE